MNQPLASTHENHFEQTTKRYKRRKILVKRGFQIRQAAISLALFALAAFIVWWETYQSLSGLANRGLIVDPGMMVIVKRISQIVALKVTVALTLVWVLSILLSHFVAGPIFRLEKGLAALKNRDFSHRIHLRRWDELKFVADKFNEVAEELEKSDRTKDRPA